METTKKLGLKITTELTFESDDIKETITEYGKNFKKIEENLADSISDEFDLVEGGSYEYGKRVWNELPDLGEYVGWVNIRGGVYAPDWKPLKIYTAGNLIKATPDNGNVYRCVSEGRSMNKTPTFLTSSGAKFWDASGMEWYPEYNYEVDDVVFSTNGSKLFYFICETAGLSSTDEPDWDTVTTGTTTIDGTVVWRKEKNVEWEQVDSSCNFRPFGKIE